MSAAKDFIAVGRLFQTVEQFFGKRLGAVGNFKSRSRCMRTDWREVVRRASGHMRFDADEVDNRV